MSSFPIFPFLASGSSCPFFKLCFFSQYQLWCLSFTGVNAQAKANFILRHSNICRLYISSHPAIHLQTICANTLFQIHAAVVTYGQSAALPADVHSELPQHELQTAWRNCSINSFRPRSTDWKKVAIKCKHWINMWILLFLCRGKTEQKAWNKFCTIIISSLLLPTSSLLSLVETHNLWFWSLHPSRVLPNSWN